MKNYFGRTEYIGNEKGIRKLVWAIYEGNESDGYEGKEPVAWFLNHSDAIRFAPVRSPYQDIYSKPASPNEGGE